MVIMVKKALKSNVSTATRLLSIIPQRLSAPALPTFRRPQPVTAPALSNIHSITRDWMVINPNCHDDCEFTLQQMNPYPPGCINPGSLVYDLYSKKVCTYHHNAKTWELALPPLNIARCKPELPFHDAYQRRLFRLFSTQNEEIYEATQNEEIYEASSKISVEELYPGRRSTFKTKAFKVSIENVKGEKLRKMYDKNLEKTKDCQYTVKSMNIVHSSFILSECYDVSLESLVNTSLREDFWTFDGYRDVKVRGWRPSLYFLELLRWIVDGLIHLKSVNVNYDINLQSVVFLTTDSKRLRPKFRRLYSSEGSIWGEKTEALMRMQLSTMIVTIQRIHGLQAAEMDKSFTMFLDYLKLAKKDLKGARSHPMLFSGAIHRLKYAIQIHQNVVLFNFDCWEAQQEYALRNRIWTQVINAHSGYLSMRLKSRSAAQQVDELQKLLKFIRNVFHHIDENVAGYVGNGWTWTELADEFDSLFPGLVDMMHANIATCHPAFMAKLPHFWAVSSNIQVSGELTTSRGSGTTFQFALSLVEQLFGEAVAKEVGQSLLMHIAADTPRKEEFNKVEWSVDHIPRVLVPIGFGTEEMEAVIIVDVLRRAGADVVVASVEAKLEVEASTGTRLVADRSITSCSDEVFDLVALPGGMPGSARLRDCEVLRKITTKQADEKRFYGAICAAPAVTLNSWGLLRRKQTTCYPAFMAKLPHFWAISSNIQVSGELTTSRGPGTTFQFALSLVEQLFGEAVAKELMHIAADTPGKEEFNKVDWSIDHIPRVLIPVPNGSKEIEVVTMIDILRRANVDVTVASLEKSMQIVAAQGTKIIANKSIGNAAESIYDLIILPGGLIGAERLQKSRILKKLLKEQESAGRMYGSISSSSTILQKHGLLINKRIASHPSILSTLPSEPVDISARVVIDGKLITSTGLSTVTDFALATVDKFFGHPRARSVAEGLVFEYPRTER